MYRAIAIIAAVILCLLLMYLALGRLPLRVRLGRNTRCSVGIKSLIVVRHCEVACYGFT